MNELLLTPEAIGDNLDLEVEATYPCSDGSSTMTVSVDKLLEAQLAYSQPLIEKAERERVIKWVEDHSTFEGHGAGAMTMKIMTWWWQSLKQGEK